MIIRTTPTIKKLIIAGIVSLFLVVSIPTAVEAVTFTRKSFLQNVTSNSVEFRWVTDTKEPLIVKYGTSTSYGSQVTSDTVTGTGSPHNHARVTGLSPNTKYFYQITSQSGTALTPAGDQNHYFTTAPTVGSTAPFKFAFWGDSGRNNSPQNNAAKQLFNRKPNFAIVAGDIVYDYTENFDDNNDMHFNVYSDASPGQNTMSFAPFYVVCGNHEDSCPTVMADHTLPGGGAVGGPLTTYSFDYGNVHFVSLNSNGSFSYNASNPQSSDPQIRWAYNDLRASNQPWKIVYFHHNGWSAGSHSSNSSVNNNLVRMAAEAGADIVFWGHSHVYERWNKKDGFFPSIQQLTIGNGGAINTSSCTATSPGPGCAAKSGPEEAGFLFAEVNGNTMTIRYINEDGANTDTFTLNSGGAVTGVPTTPTPTTGSGGGQGDANGDGRVNILDYQLLSNSFGKLPGQQGYNANTDFNGDSRVNILDYQILSNNFGR